MLEGKTVSFDPRNHQAAFSIGAGESGEVITYYPTPEKPPAGVLLHTYEDSPELTRITYDVTGYDILDYEFSGEREKDVDEFEEYEDRVRQWLDTHVFGFASDTKRVADVSYHGFHILEIISVDYGDRLTIELHTENPQTLHY